MVIQSNPEHLRPPPIKRSFSRNASKRQRRNSFTATAPASPRIDPAGDGDCSLPDVQSLDDWQAPILSLSNDTFFTDVFDDESDEEESSSEWQERNSEKHRLWEEALPRIASDMLASAEHRSRMFHRLAGLEISQKQCALNESWSIVRCRCGSADCVELDNSRNVRYWGKLCTGIIMVPIWTCSKCGDTWEASALSAGCFPHGNHRFGPLQADEWFDYDMLGDYAALGPGTGYLLESNALAPSGLSKAGEHLPTVILICMSSAQRYVPVLTYLLPTRL